jgi:hypothetical protein
MSIQVYRMIEVGVRKKNYGGGKLQLQDIDKV